MAKIPEKCLKCGAPIIWDKSSSYIDCEYCGYTNLINVGNFSKVKKAIKKFKKFKKSSENIVHKVQRLSKSSFYKAKETSLNFLSSEKIKRNKKLIFTIPITLLSALLVWKVSKEYSDNNLIIKSEKLLNNSSENIPFIKSERLLNIPSCKIPKVPKKPIYINGKYLDTRFIGCWVRKYGNKQAFHRISYSSNKLDVRIFADDLGPNKNIREYHQISDFSIIEKDNKTGEPNKLILKIYIVANDFHTIRRFELEDKNNLVFYWTGGESGGRTILERYNEPNN